jgi:hemoglobin/transferrin/lactoferrin receptor protein
MKKISAILFAISFMLYAEAQAQKPDTDSLDNYKKLDEVVISSGNFIESKKNIAQKIETISAKIIAETNAQNTGDLLMSTGKIFVQKSQQGGSSPVLRGFEASRILLVIDGVRMNNAIYRAGHLQNIITTDQNALSRVEITYGASSNTYGSDALGGTIQLITKAPVLSPTKKILSTGNIFSRYSTANSEKTIHADAGIGGKKFAWFQSYNYSDFGDLKMGNNYPDKYPDFGRRPFYIASVGGVDSVLKNTDDRIQKFSGYQQYDVTQKFLYQPTEKVNHLLNLQYSNSSDVPRYDRLQDKKNFGGAIGTTLRYAEWYYGPQERLLAAYELNVKRAGFFDELKLNANFQDVKESRNTREYRRYDRFDSRREHIKVYGTAVNGKKTFGQNELILGADMQLNDLDSKADRTNLQTGIKSKLDTRYPDGKSNMSYFGLFAQHLHKFSNGKLILNDGLRLQAVKLNSRILDNSFLSLPDTVFAQNNFALTGNIGLVYNVSSLTTVKVNVSSAFRAPNIDDLSKVFESSTSARQLIIPNANLKPEYTYNADVTLQHSFNNIFRLELTGFYTRFTNAIVTAPFQLNGQDSVLYNGVKSQVLANQNVNKANISGFTANVQTANFSGFTASSTISYTYGRYIVDKNSLSSIYEKQPDGAFKLVNKKVSTRPLDHVPPLMGKTSIEYRKQKFSGQLFAFYNGWKHLFDYNPDGEDNAKYATADGMPAWITLNLKVNYNITKSLQLQAGVDNIFDRNYRAFASGFSAPGRNFIFALRANW